MATDKTKIEAGEMPCPNDDCESHESGRRVIVFRSGTGTLSYRCDKCQGQQYAKAGERIHSDWMRRIGSMKGVAAPPGVAQPARVEPVAPSSEGGEVATESAPAARPAKRAAFSLRDL